MNHLFLTLLLGLPLISFSQKISPQVISNAGFIHENEDVKVSWTLGEFAIATIGDDPKLTQGMQQSKLLITTKVEDPLFEGRVSLFPNPTTDVLMVSIQDGKEEFKLLLFDSNGNLLVERKVINEMNISLENLSSAAYHLQIIRQNKIIFTSVVIKL